MLIRLWITALSRMGGSGSASESTAGRRAAGLAHGMAVIDPTSVALASMPSQATSITSFNDLLFLNYEACLADTLGNSISATPPSRFSFYGRNSTNPAAWSQHQCVAVEKDVVNVGLAFQPLDATVFIGGRGERS
jgi:hypothetical protein